jgi:hypothetical protein
MSYASLVLYTRIVIYLVLFSLVGVLCFTGFVLPIRIVIIWYSSDRCYMWHWCTYCDYLIQFWPVLYVALMYVLWLFDTVLTGVICGTDVRIVIIWYSSDRCYMWHWCTYCYDLIQFWPVLYVALMYVLWWFDTVLTGVICGTDVRIVMILLLSLIGL